MKEWPQIDLMGERFSAGKLPIRHLETAKR
jgi:hypothetical protein